MFENIDIYGEFYKGICLEDDQLKSIEYIKANPTKKYLCYFSNNTKKSTIYQNEPITYNEFPWESYLTINPDVKNAGHNNKKDAWNHWTQHGLTEGRSFSYINNSNIHNGRFGNLFFVNMFLNIISMKYNLKCSYKHNNQFNKLGIHFHKGANEYDKHLLVTEDNFMYILRNNLEPCNIIITNDVWFQTNDFCKILCKYFTVGKVRNKIIEKNVYNTRYNKNNDLFIHVRLGDVKEKSYDSFNYIDSVISNLAYDKAYITSDNIEDVACQQLIHKHKLIIYMASETDTIMFGNTCNNILMSGGTFSWMIGFLAFYSKHIYIPNIIEKWYGDIFIYDNWIKPLGVKNTHADIDNFVKLKSESIAATAKEKKENMIFVIINNLICKPIYDNYGLHYCGWKYVINRFLQTYNESVNGCSTKLFLDEWIEKLLIWGDKAESRMVVNEIHKNNHKMITFIHNPPFTKWYNTSYATNINNSIIYNNEHTNKNLFHKLKQSKLIDNIQYLYTLSCNHKEYLYKMCPVLRTKLVSVSHPIEITGNEKTFDFTLFCQNKQICHIGWWLRNFKSFINFKLPHKFSKTIVIKTGFEKEWNILSKRFDVRNITIINELNNQEYENLFVHSCMYLDLEDTTANNVILECIKFNTPIIVRKHPSLIEYLGVNYPLFFETDKELTILENSDYLCSMIQRANVYLQNMNKSHILCETFNNKLKYDIEKVQHINRIRYNTEPEKHQMTWFCLFDNLDTYTDQLENLYNNFTNQHNYKQNLLKIIICSKLKDTENYENFICDVVKYSALFINVMYIVININCYADFVNASFKQCDTPYLTIVGKMDNHDTNYTDICCNYLDSNPNIDITFTSYNITENDYTESIIFEKNKMLFVSNFSQFMFPNTGIVWRKNIHNLIGPFTNSKDSCLIRNYLQKCVKHHLNIACCHEVPLYTIS